MVDLADRIEHRRPPGRRAPGTSAVLAGTLLAGLAAIVVARWATGTGYVPAPFGLPDPGPLTAIGLPAAQYVHELAGVAVVGLLFLRWFALPGDAEPGGAGPGGAHLLLMATRWAWLWVAATAAWIGFTMSELTGSRSASYRPTRTSCSPWPAPTGSSPNSRPSGSRWASPCSAPG